MNGSLHAPPTSTRVHTHIRLPYFSSSPSNGLQLVNRQTATPPCMKPVVHAPPPPPQPQSTFDQGSPYTITPVSSNNINVFETSQQRISHLRAPLHPPGPRHDSSQYNDKLLQSSRVTELEDDATNSMGKRMVTVEVTGMQSATLRSGKVTIAKPKDLVDEGSDILEAFRGRQGGDALVHTTVIGKLLDTTTGASVLEVYPFVVRTSLTTTQTDMSDWVTAVRNELAAGVHPAPCALYARRVSKGVDAAVPSLSGADVLSAAKALLRDGPTPQSSLRVLQSKLHLLLSLSVTIASSNKSPAVASVDEEQPKQHQQEDGAVKEQNMDYCGRYDDIKILTERVYGMALLHCQIDPALLTRKLVEGCRTLSGAALQALLEDPHQLFLLVRSVEARMLDGGSVAELHSPHSSRLLATPSGHPELEKQQLGELLYPKVLDAGGGDHTAKITGMLLELEQSEVIVLIGNRTSLRARVEEATRVLAAHSQHHHANHGEETAGAQPRRRTRH